MYVCMYVYIYIYVCIRFWLGAPIAVLGCPGPNLSGCCHPTAGVDGSS